MMMLRGGIFILLGLLTLSAKAELNYAISGNTAYVAQNWGSSGNVVIASTYLGRPVTSIGEAAFLNSYITSVTIPSTVTNIGIDAFDNCAFLKSITIPAQVKTIGSYAFEYAGLTNITIPNTVRSVGDYAFRGCFFLKKATLGSGITNINSYTFANCNNLTNITFPSALSSIGNYAFDGCPKLSKLTFPSSLRNIGIYAFGDCQSLTNVTLPNGVVNIDVEAFSFCTNLASVTIPDSVKTIGAYAFSRCYNLTDITIPNSVTNLGFGAFMNSGLIHATIGSGIANIEDWTFNECPKLTSILFLGNAPTLSHASYPDIAPFGEPSSLNPITVYYLPGTTGWGTTYSGLPTVMLDTPKINGHGKLQSGSFRFTIVGISNQIAIVETSTNLVKWQPVWTNTMRGYTTNFAAAQSPSFAAHFYRLRQ